MPSWRLQRPPWRHRGSRGRDGAGCPPACVGSNPGGSHQRSGERVRVFLGESAFSFGRAGFKTCHSVGGFRETVVGVEGQVADTSPVGRVGGFSVARIGVSVAGPSRIIAGSQFGHSEPKSKAPTSSRRLHPTLRRRDARVDGVSTPEFASCSHGRTDPRSGEDFPDVDASSTGMAADDPSPVHICTPFCSGQHGDQPVEVTGLQFHSRSRYGLRGARVGEASHPGQVTPSSSGGAESESERTPTRRSARLQGVRADHRRGLVVEVAPNVVDTTAVDLSDISSW